MAGSAPTGGTGRSAVVRAVRERLDSLEADDVRRTAGLLAAAAVCLLAAVRIAVAVPLGAAPPGAQAALATTSAGAVLLPAAAAIAAGVVADSEWALVGLVAAGAFAVLSAVVPATRPAAVGVLPVVAALVAASVVVGRDGARDAVRHRATDDTRDRLTGGAARRTAFAALVVGAVGLSLGANAGLLAPGARSVGTTVALLALVAAPLAVGVSRRAAIVGAVAAAPVALGLLVAPFAAGAALLTVAAAIDPPIALAVAGVGGAVAVVAEGVVRDPTRGGSDRTLVGGRRADLVAGGLLVLGAGVPATVPRALAVVLGAHLLLVGAAAGESSGADGGDAA